VVPSFEPVQPRMATEKMPTDGEGDRRYGGEKLAVDQSQALFIELGRSFNDGRGQSVEVAGTTRRKPARIYQSPRS